MLVGISFVVCAGFYVDALVFKVFIFSRFLSPNLETLLPSTKTLRRGKTPYAPTAHFLVG